MAATISTSARVEFRPSEKRTSELASAGFKPSAETTCEGVSEPAEHAEPLDAQMPSRSKPASNVMLSVFSTTKESVLVRREAQEPTKCTPGVESRVTSRRSRRGLR